MPELPDIESYVEALRERVLGEPLLAVKLASPFLVRTADPPLREVEGRRVEAVRRLGKRIVLGLEGELFLALHLMIAGRLRWQEPGGKKPSRRDAARHVRVPRRHAPPHRGGHEAARGAAPAARRGRPRRAGPGRARAARRRRGCLRRGAPPREPHLEARPHRSAISSPASATPTRTRSCTARGSRRSSSPSASPTTRSPGSSWPPARCSAPGRAAPDRARRRLPRARHRLPPRVRGPRPLSPALPRLRRSRAAHRSCGERDQLLPALPDGWEDPRPTARWRGCSRTTGRGRSTSWSSGLAWDSSRFVDAGRQFPCNARARNSATRLDMKSQSGVSSRAHTTPDPLHPSPERLCPCPVTPPATPTPPAKRPSCRTSG